MNAPDRLDVFEVYETILKLLLSGTERSKYMEWNELHWQKYAQKSIIPALQNINKSKTGGVAEWFKAAVLKTAVGVTLP